MSLPPEVGGDSGPSAAPLPERLRAAEDRLFPLAMVDTDRYQRATQLVGLLGPVVLERAPSLEELDGCAGACLAEARLLASRHAIVVADLDLSDIVDAARAQRLRQLLVEAESSSAADRIAEAAAAGLAWAVIEEPDARTLGMAPEQRWVELHLATRARLVRTVRMDPSTGEARFSVEVRTDDGQGMAIGCSSRQEWLETADDLRASFEGLP